MSNQSPLHCWCLLSTNCFFFFAFWYLTEELLWAFISNVIKMMLYMISSKSCRRVPVCFCRYRLVLCLLKDGPYFTQSKPLFRVREMWKLFPCLMTVDLGSRVDCGRVMKYIWIIQKQNWNEHWSCSVAYEGFKQCQCTPVWRVQVHYRIPLDRLWLSDAAVHMQLIWLSRSMAMCRETARSFQITGVSLWENAFSKTEYVLWDPLEMSQFCWLQGAAFCIWSRLVWSK